IYEGSSASSASPQSTPVVAIIAENGQGRIASADGTYYRLNVGTSGNNMNGAYSDFTQGGSTQTAAAPGSGAQGASGTVGGMITSSGLNMTLTNTTSAPQSLTLAFDTVYNRPSSLASLAGSWTATANGVTMTATVQPDGSFTASDSNNCTYLGNFSLIDPTFDVYAETHVRSCNGAAITFTGLAALLPANTASGNGMEIKLMSDNDAGEYLMADFE
ncbi:MAG TPA: hypothetical protein VI653_10150, partial [Steroidobacteraceae bacterium]